MSTPTKISVPLTLRKKTKNTVVYESMSTKDERAEFVIYVPKHYFEAEYPAEMVMELIPK